MLKRGLTDRISTPLIDQIYEAARRSGATGGKLLGAGGGGFLLLYVEPESQESVKETLKDLLQVPVHFESSGSRVIFYEPDGQPASQQRRSVSRTWVEIPQVANR